MECVTVKSVWVLGCVEGNGREMLIGSVDRVGSDSYVCRSCATSSGVIVVSRSFPGRFQVVSRSFPGRFQVVSVSVNVVCRSFPGRFQVVSRSFPGRFQVVSRSFLCL